MKDSLTSSNYHDFRQRYQNTYGNFVPEGKPPLMVMLQTVEETRVHFMDARGTAYHVNADSGIPFEFYPVDRRVANSSKGAVLYSCRRPARQWSRGVCEGNTTITNLVANRSVGISFDSLEVLYHPNKNYVAALQDYIDGKREGVAIDDKFCIIREVVQLYDKPIGMVDRTNLFTAKIHPMFKQEFSDTVKRGNLPIAVEVHNG